MKDIIKFLIAFGASFAIFYKLFSKKEENEKEIEIKPFKSDAKLVDVLKKFNEIKQNI